jgi:glucarate dehydratase
MKITHIDIIPISIPLKAPIRWPWGCRVDACRTIIRLDTDTGLVGYGETMCGATIDILRTNAEKVIGTDPFEIERLLSRFLMLPYFSGYSAQGAIAGIEMACWDLMGKRTGKSVCEIMGGRFRKDIDIAAYIFSRYANGDEGGENNPELLAASCVKLRDKYGFNTFKYKGGLFEPAFDLETLTLMREYLGPDTRLRIDPNAGWSFEMALKLGKEMLPLDLEYLEDPVWGLDSMARLRRDVPIPFATNMCVVDFDSLPVGIRMGSVDIVLADPHKWGGMWNTKKLAGVCESFGMGMSIHSGAEAGLSTAANLHLAASTPQIYFAIDSHYHHFSGDILTDMHQFKDGQIHVPEGPGLGVDVDGNKLKKYADRFNHQGEIEFAGTDAYRPEWLPTRPLWT